MNRTFPVIAVVIGVLLFVPGIFFSALYISEAVLKKWGDADQSLVFWYLPLLFTGLGAILSGVLLSVWGCKRLRMPNEKP